MLVCITSYDSQEDKRLKVFRLDTTDGCLHPLGSGAEELENPLYVRQDPTSRFLYVTDHVKTSDGTLRGELSAFAIDRDSGSLRHLNRQPSGGVSPCYVDVSNDGRYVSSANYTDGSVSVLSVESDGSLGELVSMVLHEGHSVDANRQTGPHPHSFRFDPDNRFALAADLGADQIVAYRFDSATGQLSTGDLTTVDAPPGAGPRHIAFSSDGRVAYVINELDSTIMVMDYDPGTGQMSSGQIVKTQTGDFSGASTAADIHVHPNGRFVYASNRLADADGTISVFRRAEQTGDLTLMDQPSTQGRSPRAFGIDPGGQFLIVGNEGSDTIVSFRIDRDSGALTPTGTRVRMSKPACVAFVG